MDTDSKILMIGCGGLGKAILELIPICKFIPKRLWSIDIIEPLPDFPAFLDSYEPACNYKINLFRFRIDKDNFSKVDELLRNKVLCIDVSTGIDALDMLKLCYKNKVLYINTSIEAWEIENPEILSKDLYKRTLHHQYLEIMNYFKDKKDTTMLLDHGMNPGMISHMAKRGINDMYNYKNKTNKVFTKRAQFQDASESLNLISIHVAEYDSQEASIPLKKNTFYNSWSIVGLITESLDPTQVGYNDKDPVLKSLEKISPHITPESDGDNYAYYHMRGMDHKVTSVALDRGGKPFKFRGYLISHGEANTLSRYLRKNTNPSVYYVYKPCGPAIQSLENMRKADYKMPAQIHTVFLMPELKDGIDSIGAFIQSRDLKWWMGTILSSADVRKLGVKYSTPTTVQVVISLLAGVKFLLKNPALGVITPESLPYNQIIKDCEPFLGKVVSKKINL